MNDFFKTLAEIANKILGPILDRFKLKSPAFFPFVAAILTALFVFADNLLIAVLPDGSPLLGVNQTKTVSTIQTVLFLLSTVIGYSTPGSSKEPARTVGAKAKSAALVLGTVGVIGGASLMLNNQKPVSYESFADAPTQIDFPTAADIPAYWTIYYEFTRPEKLQDIQIANFPAVSLPYEQRCISFRVFYGTERQARDTLRLKDAPDLEGWKVEKINSVRRELYGF